MVKQFTFTRTVHSLANLLVIVSCELCKHIKTIYFYQSSSSFGKFTGDWEMFMGIFLCGHDKTIDERRYISNHFIHTFIQYSKRYLEA